MARPKKEEEKQHESLTQTCDLKKNLYTSRAARTRSVNFTLYILATH